MTVKTPLYMDINNVYSGDEMGLPNRDYVSQGVIGSVDLLVTAGAGNTVNVAAGACWVLGDTDIVNQPIYRIINDATVNLGIAPDPTNPRIYRIGLQINDAGFVGSLRNGVMTAIAGTPAGSPVAPAEPASFISFATVLVPAAAASSAAYTFTDVRPYSFMGGGQAVAAKGYFTSAATSIPNNALTTLPASATSYSASGISYPSNAIVVRDPGIYLVTANIQWGPSNVGYRQIMFIPSTGVNMLQLQQSTNPAVGDWQSLAGIFKLVASDTVQLAIAQNSGGALNCTMLHHGICRIG